MQQDYPGIQFLVQPVDAGMLKQQLKGLPAALSEAERAGYAREAAALLARIAAERKGPLAADLTAAEPALAVALGWARDRAGRAASPGRGARP